MICSFPFVGVRENSIPSLHPVKKRNGPHPRSKADGTGGRFQGYWDWGEVSRVLMDKRLTMGGRSSVKLKIDLKPKS